MRSIVRYLTVSGRNMPLSSGVYEDLVQHFDVQQSQVALGIMCHIKPSCLGRGMVICRVVVGSNGKTFCRRIIQAWVKGLL